MRQKFAASAVIAAALALSGAAQAQLSAYYATQGTAADGTTYVWQNGALQFQYQWAADGEMPIVVGNFGSGPVVRQAVGQPESDAPEPGDEYTLNGVADGNHNLWEGASSTITAYDAATNGSNIFMVDWTSGAVYSYDNNYGNRTFLFNANVEDIGITYDPFNNSIWTNNFGNGLVEDWSMSGTALSSFFDPNGSAAALAFDTQDGTLWMSDGAAGTNIYHYSTSGQLLQTVQTNEYLLGGEMMATSAPEPLSLCALGIGAVALLRRRRS